MNDDAKAILQSLLDEIEDLRAGQTVLAVAIESHPDFSRVDLAEMKRVVREKNQNTYTALRKAIDELAY